MALACTWEAPPSLYLVTFALLGVVSLQPRSHLEENLKRACSQEWPGREQRQRAREV